MDRRWAGVALLLAALLLIATPRLLAPSEVGGTGVAAPFPEPPPIGACLLADGTVVPCDQSHYSEVTARWTADDPARETASVSSRCDAAADRYTSLPEPPLPDWFLPINLWSGEVEAPPSERIGARGWAVCAVGTGPGTDYQGSLRSITLTQRPLATFSCLLATTPNYDVDCDLPHGRERLAVLSRLVPDPNGAATPVSPQGFMVSGDRPPVFPVALATGIEAECRELAADLTGSADPTRGGLLRTAVEPTIFSADPTYPGMAFALADCTIGAADDRNLHGTMVGLGDAAVPFV